MLFLTILNDLSAILPTTDIFLLLVQFVQQLTITVVNWDDSFTDCQQSYNLELIHKILLDTVI